MTGEKYSTHAANDCVEITIDQFLKEAGMRQNRPNRKIFGQAQRPAPTIACRGDSLWSPRSKEFDFDAVLFKEGTALEF